MAWFKVDDNFYDHPKVDELSLAAVGLWLLTGTYCARQLTDGFIPTRRIEKLGGNNDAVIAELVSAGLWDEADGGYQFHDWGEYQPTKDSVESKRESDRERKRRQRRNPSGQFEESARSHGGTPDGITAESRVESHRPGPARPDPSPSVPTRRRPERPIPDEWAPNDAHKAYASKKNISLDFQVERFRNHAQANDRRARDWDAAFRNWLLKAEPSKTATSNALWEVTK